NGMKTTFHQLVLTFLLLAFIQISNAQTKYLWATTTIGGTLGYGTILQGDSDGSNFHVVYAFDQTNGAQPIGNMAVTASGLLYGITVRGGYEDSCVIYTYDPATGTYTKIYDDMFLPVNGDIPVGGLTLCPN